MNRWSKTFSLLVAVGWWWSPTQAVLPTAEILVQASDGLEKYTMLASQASFGPLSPMDKNSRAPSRLQLPPLSNPLLCENVTLSSSSSSSSSNSALSLERNTVLVVPRGDCTYQHKALQAQKLGAVGVILYNTLASRYSINTTAHEGEKFPSYSTKDILFPQEYYDYDCHKGSASIPTVDLSFSPLPYDGQTNDPLLSGDTQDNLCVLHSEDSLRHCDSKRCLVTGLEDDDKNDNNNKDSSTTRVCCAWDLHLWLYPDPTMENETSIDIPMVFLTMDQGAQLLETIKKDSTTQVLILSRWRPNYNVSALLIWMLGVCVAAMASYWSAKDYHIGIRKLIQCRRNARTLASLSNGAAGLFRPTTPLAERNPMQEETLELEPIHALGFVVMASTSLFVLFYFEIYNVVKVMYAIGCSNALVQVLITPLVDKGLRKLGCPPPRVLYESEDVGTIRNWDVLAAAIGYAWGMTWLYMAVTVPHSDQYAFFWITQNILGTCMCIVFLGMIQLNSIQVASILLVVAFVYDIFFVFVTPYIFKKSIMITVATSGGPPKADPLWCEKYPSDADCQGGDPLPMLMTVPRLLDYQGGSSMLGLGDIVLPGLLLSFAARLDAAKRLVGIVSGGRTRSSLEPQQCEPERCCQCSYNYFVPLVIAYAIGLLMANVAVYVMNMGQPALLYLVPCTLGTMSFLGWRRKELKALWDGPRILNTADDIVYGKSQPQSEANPPSSLESTVDPTVVEEFVDDETGDVPLLSTSATTAPEKDSSGE